MVLVCKQPAKQAACVLLAMWCLPVLLVLQGLWPRQPPADGMPEWAAAHIWRRHAAPPAHNPQSTQQLHQARMGGAHQRASQGGMMTLAVVLSSVLYCDWASTATRLLSDISSNMWCRCGKLCWICEQHVACMSPAGRVCMCGVFGCPPCPLFNICRMACCATVGCPWHWAVCRQQAAARPCRTCFRWSHETSTPRHSPGEGRKAAALVTTQPRLSQPPPAAACVYVTCNQRRFCVGKAQALLLHAAPCCVC